MYNAEFISKCNHLKIDLKEATESYNAARDAWHETSVFHVDHDILQDRMNDEHNRIVSIERAILALFRK